MSAISIVNREKASLTECDTQPPSAGNRLFNDAAGSMDQHPGSQKSAEHSRILESQQVLPGLSIDTTGGDGVRGHGFEPDQSCIDKLAKEKHSDFKVKAATPLRAEDNDWLN